MELYPQIAECIVKLMNGFMDRFSKAAEERTVEQVEAIGVCCDGLAEIIIPDIELW